jgi:hypothetical protein
VPGGAITARLWQPVPLFVARFASNGRTYGLTMLYYVSRADTSATIWNFIITKGWTRVPFLRPLTYEGLFQRRKAPRGHYIFTDFDRLSAYEVQSAIALATALREADPQIQIYNHPGRALERVPLLARLFAEGINSFQVTRIDAGQRPPAYPVFIRCEDDCKRPDTGLLHSEVEFDEALVKLRETGVPLKRRIAVEYRAAVSPDGYFRKYGALRIGGRVFPQHILRNADWYVKHGQVTSDDTAAREFIELFDNYEWHARQLETVFNLAGLDYGRADYGIVDGKIEVYEINTNPTLGGDGRPRPDKRKRSRSRDKQARTLPLFLDGFRNMNPPHARGGRVSFKLPKPQFHDFPGLDFMSRVRLAYYWSRAIWTRVRPPVLALPKPSTPAITIGSAPAGERPAVAPSQPKVEHV